MISSQGRNLRQGNVRDGDPGPLYSVSHEEMEAKEGATDFLTLSCAPWSTVEGAETGEERSQWGSKASPRESSPVPAQSGTAYPPPHTHTMGIPC